MPVTCPHTRAHPYCRREPEKHPLYQILAQHLETFLLYSLPVAPRWAGLLGELLRIHPGPSL